MLLENSQQRVRTVWWESDEEGAMVRLLDQSALPLHIVHLKLRHEQEVADAITTLKVRGAPVIGVTAAFGVTLSLYHLLSTEQSSSTTGITSSQAHEHVRAAAKMLAGTRPTAVNLFWAIERMLHCLDQTAKEQCTPRQLAQKLLKEAHAIADEDEAACLRMGRYGADLIADGDTLLTHCNAGALATAGLGTALAPLYVAYRSGKRIHVFVDETRPVLQGSRLTAWELQQERIPLTLITDSMAGHFMRQGDIKAVFVGADRIAANGDVANKIGTYSVAVLAHAHHIPFYVVAPRSTIDSSLASGDLIPIEQRSPQEVTSIRGVELAPAGVLVANPAFDVTPHSYVTAIVTDKGIVRPPYTAALQQILAAR